MLFRLSFTILMAMSLAQNTTDSPANILNNLAALESAENILKTIDDLTVSTTTQMNPVFTTTTKDTEQVASMKVTVVTPNMLNGDKRRAGGIAPGMESIYGNENGLRALFEIKRRMEGIFRNPDLYSALNQHVFTYGVPRHNLYLNNALPSQVELLRQPNYLYDPPSQQGLPFQYLKELEDQDAFPQYVNLDQKLRKIDENLAQYAQTSQKIPKLTRHTQEANKPFHSFVNSQRKPRIKPVQNFPVLPTPVPNWMLLALQAVQGRRPMNSPTIRPQLQEQLSYDNLDKDIFLAPDYPPNMVEAAFQETNVTPVNLPEWHAPQSLNPTLYVPESTRVPIATQHRAMLTVSVPEKTTSPLITAPQINIRSPQIRAQGIPIAMPGRLQVNRLLPVGAPVSTTQTLKDFRPPKKPFTSSVSRAPSKMPSRVLPRLPALPQSRFSSTSSKKKPQAESLMKLTKFMRENRDTLLQFISMKRNLLLEQKKGAPLKGNALTNQAKHNVATSKRYPPRPPNKSTLMQNVPTKRFVVQQQKQVLANKGLLRIRPKGKAKKPNRGNQPVARARPEDFPANEFDLAPAKGGRIARMRLKDRICQRNVMVVSGPKYDSNARVIKDEFRPGIDGKDFHVTRRKKFLIPACCNCCKKSVLGCQ